MSKTGDKRERARKAQEEFLALVRPPEIEIKPIPWDEVAGFMREAHCTGRFHRGDDSGVHETRSPYTGDV